MKITDKLTKVDKNLTISMHDNGYLLEVSGTNDNNDYATAYIITTSLTELIELVKEAAALERTS